MARTLLALLTSLLLTGCQGLLVGSIPNPQMSTSSVSGIVIVVHLETASNVNGTSGKITAVTFSNGGLSTNVNFCGDQQSQFPLNRSVRASFNPGSVCSTLIAVVSL